MLRYVEVGSRWESVTAGGEKKQGQQGLDSLLERGGDKALEHTFKGWLSRADDNQKFALIALAFALALGPLGQGLLAALGVLFNDASIPSTVQLEATFWLILITLPIALPVFVCVAYWGRLSLYGMAFVVALCVFWGVSQQDYVNTQRGDVYCYAELHGLETTYESECREFNQRGFASDASQIHGPPPAAAGMLAGLAFSYTAEARGFLMAFCGVVAAASIGYLVRRQME